jgi:hypothetical protein
VRFLGAPLSSSKEYVSSFAEGKAREVGEVLGKLHILRDRQGELLLLRSCLWVCRLLHVLRCSPADSVDEGVEVFDNSQREAVRRIVVGDGCGFGPLLEELAALPLSSGPNPPVAGGDLGGDGSGSASGSGG